MHLKEDQLNQPEKISKDFEEMAPVLMSVFKAKNVPHWIELLKQAKEIGDVEITLVL